MDLASEAQGIGALADRTRRALYEYVVAQTEPVGREQAAAALGLAQHNVNFHLDRLVSEGLLEVEYRRLSGRSGPGAGRPSKLYRRTDREIAITLPPRRYDLVGDILAGGVSRAAEGFPMGEALREVATEEGRAVGRAATGRDLGDLGDLGGLGDQLGAMTRVLAGQGYEPRLEDRVVALTNCPFDTLAKKHTELVCRLNRDFVQGVADGLGCDRVVAALEPEPDRCCVKARLRAPGRVRR